MACSPNSAVRILGVVPSKLTRATASDSMAIIVKYAHVLREVGYGKRISDAL